MAQLPPPSPGLAARVLRQVEYPERLGGFRLNAMAGHTPHDLYSLEEVLGFLRVDPFAALLAPGGRSSVGYVDLKVLARWVEEVLGDGDLASAVREAAGQSETYAEQVGPVRAVLAQRLDQCRAALAEAGEQTRTPAEKGDAPA